MKVQFSDPLVRTLCDLLCSLYSCRYGNWQPNPGYDRWGVNRLKYWHWAETARHGSKSVIRLTDEGKKVAVLVTAIMDKSELEKVL